MFHQRRTASHEPSYYLHDLLVWRLAEVATTPRSLARECVYVNENGQEVTLSHNTVAEALSGECKKFFTLRLIADTLGLKWEYLFKLDLPKSQFRRAVSETVR